MKTGIEIPKSELAKLSRDLKKYGKHKQDEIWKEVSIAADNIKNEAQNNAPRATSNLAGGIHTIPNKSKLEHTVEANAEYSPYIEFGTGNKVFKGSFNFSNDIKQYARKFKGKGIRKVNLPSRPFLFPAIDEYWPKMIRNIQKLLSKK